MITTGKRRSTGLACRVHAELHPLNPSECPMLRASALALATLTVASSASAEFVDFRNASEFGGSNYGTSATFNTDSGANATITPGPVSASFYWGTDDGFGVRYNGSGAYEYDEIEGPESLSITFSEPVYIESVLVSDLFREQTNLGSTYNETGTFTVTNGTSSSVGSIVANGTPSGDQTVSVGAWATSIVFRGAGYVGGFLGLNRQTNDYSLAGITFGATAVPELDPSAAGTALILLLGGLMVLGGKRRNTLLG